MLYLHVRAQTASLGLVNCIGDLHTNPHRRIDGRVTFKFAARSERTVGSRYRLKGRAELYCRLSRSISAHAVFCCERIRTSIVLCNLLVERNYAYNLMELT